MSDVKSKITVADEPVAVDGTQGMKVARKPSAQGKITEAVPTTQVAGKITEGAETAVVTEGRPGAITSVDGLRPGAKGKITEAPEVTWLKQGDRVVFGNNLLAGEPIPRLQVRGSFEIIGPEEDPKERCLDFPQHDGVAWLRDRRTGRPVTHAPADCNPLDYDFLVYEHFGDAYAWFKVLSTEIDILMPVGADSI